MVYIYLILAVLLGGSASLLQKNKKKVAQAFNRQRFAIEEQLQYLAYAYIVLAVIGFGIACFSFLCHWQLGKFGLFLYLLAILLLSAIFSFRLFHHL